MIRLVLFCALAPAAALAQGAPVGGVYLDDGERARIVLPADTPLPDGLVTVILPDFEGGPPEVTTVAPGERIEPADNDLMVFEAPEARQVPAQSAERSIGFVFPGTPGVDPAAGTTADLDGNGIPETLVACTSSESVQLALTEGEGDALRLVWWLPVYLGYDTEPTCPEALFAAVERGM